MITFKKTVLIILAFISGCVHSSSTAKETQDGQSFNRPPVSVTDNTPINPSGFFPDRQWPVISPESAGWDIPLLSRALDIFDDNLFTALVVVQNGYLVVQRGDIAKRVRIYSMRKSIVSALFGIYSDKGVIKDSKSMLELGIDDYTPLTAVEKRATIRDLLMARSGIYLKAALETSSMKKRRPLRGSHPPGTFWYYNNWDFNVLGHIFEKQSGKSLFQAFSDEFAVPLGMQDFRVSDGGYVKKSYTKFPGYYFRMSARDCARFGYLYLRKGKWKNKQILSSKWVKTSTNVLSIAGKGIGYGYLWWVSTGKYHLKTKTGKGTFSARGNWGQYIIVIPEYDMVIVKVVDKKSGAKRQNRRETSEMIKLLISAAPKP
ncbi:MAG: serine hydrolase [Deltaproteobacteria bacterium]|nr:serine hydrolase [Deltaproteobacteria bacterium]